MCTTGVLRIGAGDYLLFKNKDFGRPHFDDRIVTEPGVFGVRGVSTWAGTDPDADQFSGFSIGANEHGLLCCDSNVRTLEGHANYDELTEVALRRGTDVGSAVAAITEAVESRPYLWANLIMIDDAGAAAVEVRGDRVEATALDGPTARSNHHVALKPHPEDDDTVTTQKRLASAQRRLDEASGIDDGIELQSSHDDGDTGICNHQGYGGHKASLRIEDLISGVRSFPQAWEQLLRGHAGDLQVESVAAHVDFLAPSDRVARAEMHASEERVVLPGDEHAVTSHIRQVQLALDAVVVADPDPVRLQGAHLNGAGCLVASRHASSLSIRRAATPERAGGPRRLVGGLAGPRRCCRRA